MARTTQPALSAPYNYPSISKMGEDVGVWAALQPEVVTCDPPEFFDLQQQHVWRNGFTNAYQTTVQAQIDHNRYMLEDLQRRGQRSPETCHESWQAACAYFEAQIEAWSERIPEYPAYTGVLTASDADFFNSLPSKMKIGWRRQEPAGAVQLTEIAIDKEWRQNLE